VVPVPVKGTLNVGFVGSLLTIEMLPLTAPLVAGENVAVTWADCPALMVFGVVIPLIPKALPLTVIMDTVRSADPTLFSVRLAVLFSPFDKVPKSIEAGETDNCGEPLTAVAERLATTGELLRSPVTVNVPVTFPADVGFTATVIVPDCPTARDIGKLVPAKLNCVFEKAACVMLTATVPEFETETACVAGFPTETLPKLRALGFSWKSAWVACFPGPVTIPAQPLKEIRAIRATATKTACSNVIPQLRSLLTWVHTVPA
jgi:hypothetical protein